MKNLLALILLITIFIACAPTVQWTKSGYSQVVFDYDQNNCQTEAEATVPQVKGSSTAQNQTMNTLFQGLSSRENDERQAKLDDYISGCLAKKGYYQQ
jgi:hypothetical protein